jgi:hypothetical protein
MSSTPVFQAIADFLQWTFQFFDWVGDKLNWAFILLGAFGLLYWLWTQKKLNDKAANNPNQLK